MNSIVKIIQITPQQFKIGDWVKDTRSDKVFQITPETFNLNYQGNIYKLWQPQPNEWCWLYGKLIKLTDISNIEYCQYITSVGDDNEASYEYLQSNCEPFIGTLPTFLKDE